MRVVHKKKALPRDWSRLPGVSRALYVGDVTMTRKSRLRMKLLVFRSNRDLAFFWKRNLGGSLGKRCRGAVNSLGVEVIDFKGGKVCDRRLEVDGRYFCVMGLLVTHLSMEIISHESVHAGFSYAKRVHRKDLFAGARDNDEEEVCYPAGRVAAAVNRILHDEGLYALSERLRGMRA